MFSECCNLCFHHKVEHFITSNAQQNGILVKLKKKYPAVLHLSKEICFDDGTESIAVVYCLVDFIEFSYGREFVLKNADCKKISANQSNFKSVLMFLGFCFGFCPGVLFGRFGFCFCFCLVGLVQFFDSDKKLLLEIPLASLPCMSA